MHLPSRPELAAHCQRVAAWALEIGARLGLSGRPMTALEHAALRHHSPSALLDAAAVSRLLADLFPSGPPRFKIPRTSFWEWFPEDLTAAVLRGYLGIGHEVKTEKSRLLVEILTLGNLFDEQLQLRGLESTPAAQLWAELEALRGIIQSPVLEAARQALDAPFRVPAQTRWEFGVHAAAAQEVLCTLAAHPDFDVLRLADLAAKDPVMAGKLIETANSALYTRQTPVQSIPQAISYIGTEATRKVLMALAMKRLFASAETTGIWRHSVWMAQYCEAFACDTALLAPDEALLLGLMHDVGRIAIATLPKKVNEALARLVRRGCPLCYAEQTLLGYDHAEIGAEVLASWRFPDAIVEAVRHHHRPADSDSAAACLLHLAEFWAETDEDLPSVRHMNVALTRTGCSLETLARIQHLDKSLERMLGVV